MKIAIISLLFSSMFLLPSRGFTQQSSDDPVAAQAQSLGDIARKIQADKAAAAKANPVSVPVHELQGNSLQQATSIPKTEESASSALEKFRNLGKEELGAAVLKMANANVDFLGRRDWEDRLFEAKQAWLDQVDRMMAHKDSNQSAQDTEIGLARKARLNFESIQSDGIEQAQAVNDPVLRAHREYEKQLDFCKQTTGDLLSRCLSSVELLKYRMQKEGTW